MEGDNPVKEDGGIEVDYHSVTTMGACVLKKANGTQGINSGRSSHDNLASDFTTLQSHVMDVVYR